MFLMQEKRGNKARMQRLPSPGFPPSLIHTYLYHSLLIMLAPLFPTPSQP